MSPGEIIAVPIWLELGAVAFGAFAGANQAVRHRFDLVGVMGLAIAGALGGGLLRDILLQRGTPIALTDPLYLPVTVTAGVGAVLFASILARFGTVLVVVDALALGLFTVIGAEKAQLYGLPVASVMLIGVVTAVGGTLIRDVLVAEPVSLFRPGLLNASASLVGSAVFVLLVGTTISRSGAEWAAVAVTVGLRLVSVRHNVQLRTAKSLRHDLRRLPRRVADGFRGRRPPAGPAADPDGPAR